MSVRQTKPTIAVDIDDVLFPFVIGIAEHFNKLNGATLTPEDFISFKFEEVWGGTAEESVVIVDEFQSTDSIELLPVAGASQAFSRLRADFEIVLVTARNSLFEPQTTSWLQAHFPGLFDGLIFAGNDYDGRGFRTKGEICKEIGAVLLIDDHPKNILSATKVGIDGILFGEKAWTNMDSLSELSVRHCRNWEETVGYIYDEWQSK